MTYQAYSAATLERREALDPRSGRAENEPDAASARHDRRLRILVVDDHDVVHWGFRLMLGRQPWVERCLPARSPQKALELTRRYQPHVAAVDLFVGGEPGREICARLREEWSSVKLLLMSSAGRIAPKSARAAGASGFVMKDLPAPDIVKAIRMVGLGMSVFPRHDKQSTSMLSRREREVLDLIAAGATNPEIATRLYLSPHTVKDYTSTLYRKLDVRKRAEAVQRAQRLGLIA